MNALDPARRLALLDALGPPPGFFLDAAIGTAFSLDFEVFTAVVLAFIGAELDDPTGDPASVLTALARLRHRMRVLVNAGGLHPPARPNKLFALYDRVLRPVGLGDTAFHPKVWVLKFAPLETPESRRLADVYRVLVSSRNMTASHSWELAARFEGSLESGDGFGSEVAGFLKKLTVGRDLPTAVVTLLSELPRVSFQRGPEARDGLHFYWQWPGGPTLAPRLPNHVKRGLLISPFVRAGFLRTLQDRVGNLTVVSTQTELDALPDDVIQRCDPVKVFVVTRAPVEEAGGLDLHAKLLVWEDGERCETLVGSANATGAAWGLSGRANCEALVALTPGIRIDDVIRAFVSPERGSLHPWIETYERVQVEPDDLEKAKQRLAALQRGLAGLDLHATHDPRERLLSIRSRRPLPEPLKAMLGGVTAEIVPFLRADMPASWTPLARVFQSGARFEVVDPPDVCAFSVIRLQDRVNACEVQFCVQMMLTMDESAMDGRDDAIHAELLKDVDPRVLILNVLRGLPAGNGAFERQAGLGAGHAYGSVLEQATVERVMEACTADPSRVREIDAVVRACRAKPGMEAFVSFWDSFKAAMEEVRRG